MYSMTAQAVFPKLDAIFSRVSVPVVCRTDNGPPFNRCEFGRFARTMVLEHRKVTPLWPRANSEVERFMSTVRKQYKQPRWRVVAGSKSYITFSGTTVPHPTVPQESHPQNFFRQEATY